MVSLKSELVAERAEVARLQLELSRRDREEVLTDFTHDILQQEVWEPKHTSYQCCSFSLLGNVHFEGLVFCFIIWQKRELARNFEAELRSFMSQLQAERSEMKAKLEEQSELRSFLTVPNSCGHLTFNSFVVSGQV